MTAVQKYRRTAHDALAERSKTLADRIRKVWRRSAAAAHCSISSDRSRDSESSRPLGAVAWPVAHRRRAATHAPAAPGASPLCRQLQLAALQQRTQRAATATGSAHSTPSNGLRPGASCSPHGAHVRRAKHRQAVPLAAAHCAHSSTRSGNSDCSRPKDAVARLLAHRRRTAVHVPVAPSDSCSSRSNSEGRRPRGTVAQLTAACRSQFARSATSCSSPLSQQRPSTEATAAAFTRRHPAYSPQTARSSASASRSGARPQRRWLQPAALQAAPAVTTATAAVQK
jgi:hypothetical protein